jgi:hypothetical protein
MPTAEQRAAALAVTQRVRTGGHELAPGVKQIILLNPRKYNITAIVAPYNSLSEFIYAQRWRLTKLNRTNAVAYANAKVEETQKTLGIRIDRVWEQNRFEEKVKSMLAMGFTCIAAGAAIGSAIFPGIGTLVGALAGACVALAIGLLPQAEWDVQNAFQSYINALSMEERYMHFQMFRELSNHALDKAGRPHFEPWRLIDCHDDLFCNWDKPELLPFWMFQQLWRMDSIPNDPSIYLWVRAMACCDRFGDQLPTQAEPYNSMVNLHMGSQWAVANLQRDSVLRVDTIRNAAIANGLPDCNVIPLPVAVQDRLVEIEAGYSHE